MSTDGNSANHTGMVAESSQAFGGSWTELKLELLAAYLEAYSIALKNQGFKKNIRGCIRWYRLPGNDRRRNRNSGLA